MLLKNAILVDPEAKTETPGAVLIEDGMIAEVFDTPEPGAKAKEVIDCGGKHLAPGIIDIGVKVCEPGERHKESYASAGAAAACGGVTTMVIRPDTVPAIDSPEILEFVHRRAVEDAPVNVLSMAALTKARAGQEMAEIGFLKDTGAVAFTDCDHVISNNKILSRCLTYARSHSALVMLHCQDPSLSDGAAATSGAVATKLGLPAVSTMAERMELERLVNLVKMTGAQVHIDQITTADAILVLERAKANGLPLTAGISIHHLTLNENDIEAYPTFFKVKPPLRNEDHRHAVVQALADGLIDVVSSMHTPQDEESKRLPFEAAASGAVGLETLLPAVLRLVHSEDIALPQLWAALSLNPARLLGLDAGRLSAGAPADLTLFDANAPFVLDRFKLASKSKNTPFDGQRLQGKVVKTFVRGNLVYSG